MRQETGNNLPQTAYEVSIQQSLDGHSFSVAGLSADFPANKPVEVGVLTAQTMLVPAELFDAAQSAAMLAANGMPLLAGQQIVCSEPQAEIVAVMAVSCEAMRQVCEKFGERARFTTPLLCVPGSMDSVVWICLEASLLYIKVYDGKLRFAEVIPVQTDADIRYLTERLGSEFPLADFELRITGGNTKAVRKLLGKRFRGVICE